MCITDINMGLIAVLQNTSGTGILKTVLEFFHVKLHERV